VTIVPTIARLRAGVEEDEGQGDDPDPAREPIVAEVDQAQAVGADGHAEEEEEQQSRNAKTPRDERGEHAGGQQRAGDQNEFPVRQNGSICRGL
jgi:hypothetical protein